MKVVLGSAVGMGAGGVTSHLRTLQQSLKGEHIDVTVIAPITTERVRPWRYAAGAMSLGSRDRARVILTEMCSRYTYRRIRDAVSHGAADLVHAHDVLLGHRIASLGLPTIITVHGPASKEAAMLHRNSPRFIAYLKETERSAYHASTLIIAVDSGQRDIIVTEYGVEPDKVRVILNAVDTVLFSPRNTGPGPKYFVVPRRLVPKNGVHVAIEAMAQLKDVDAQLWILGDGPDRSMLEALTRQEGLWDRVVFKGTVGTDQMALALAGAAGVIVPSVPFEGVVEASSIAALEGMSTGKAVFASAIGGLAEMIRHGETGFLFNAGDSTGLARLLSECLEEPARFQAVGANARSYVKGKHSAEAWVKDVLEVYRDAKTLARDNSPRRN